MQPVQPEGWLHYKAFSSLERSQVWALRTTPPKPAAAFPSGAASLQGCPASSQKVPQLMELRESKVTWQIGRWLSRSHGGETGVKLLGSGH